MAKQKQVKQSPITDDFGLNLNSDVENEKTSVEILYEPETLARKTALEENGWNFELNEKQQWAADNGESRWEWYNDLHKLVRMIEKDGAIKPENNEDINYLDPPVESDTDENGFIESDGGSKKNALPVFAFESVRVKLTETEQRDRDSSLRNALNLRDAEVSRFAAEKEIHKTNVKLHEADIQKFRQICDSGHEYRELECPLEYDFQKESVITRRPDTDEIISRRGMTKEERQKRLF